ncbi:MAG TPA: LPS export ABC transporter periplasmic protein LptC [Stellaceae bacterium]|nr:LPS export ABC transporter periplasmic protein LptC [Stellaceae bacterium]
MTDRTPNQSAASARTGSPVPVGLRVGDRRRQTDTKQLQTRQYSRFVVRAKRVLPIIAGGLVLVLACWPYIASSLDHLRIGFAKIDLRDAHDLRMINASYSGLDREKRPFTVTADVARQAPDGNLVALEGPKADMRTKEGAWLAMTGRTGIYQPQAHLLDLSQDVTLFHDKGYEFKTESARVDLNSGDAQGSDPVSGQGPGGTISGQGFRVLRNGDVVYFTGKSHLVLISAKTADDAAGPPALGAAPPAKPPKPKPQSSQPPAKPASAQASKPAATQAKPTSAQPSKPTAPSPSKPTVAKSGPTNSAQQPAQQPAASKPAPQHLQLNAAGPAATGATTP